MGRLEIEVVRLRWEAGRGKAQPAWQAIPPVVARLGVGDERARVGEVPGRERPAALERRPRWCMSDHGLRVIFTG